MPRLPPSLFWRARRAAPLSTLLLPVCRDLPSSLAELRWMREHVDADLNRDVRARKAELFLLCQRRGRGEPLQYVLGTQPFGPLDLLCRPGVLIPRPEPESYSLFLADMLVREVRQSPTAPKTLTVLDACTGTGCIALLLYARLRKALGQVQTQIHVAGVDIAPAAVKLSRDNRGRNAHVWENRTGGDVSRNGDNNSTIRFHQADLFADAWQPRVVGADISSPKDHPPLLPLDVLISNPPYISIDGFAHDTARSVRQFEPRLAQVPDLDQVLAPEQPLSDNVLPEDIFYDRLITLAERFDARILLCEVGGLDQARRVVTMALSRNHESTWNIEIWADCPDIVDSDGPKSVHIAGREVPIRGSGHGRSVFIRRR